MPLAHELLRTFREHFAIGLLLGVCALLAGAWIVFEAVRGYLSRQELAKLKQRLEELERQRAYADAPAPPADPIVLGGRWVKSGGAATTSDGGCLILLERVSTAQRVAVVTLRVDGVAVQQHQRVTVGQTVTVPGSLGTYFVELSGVEGIEARLSASLRSRRP